MKNLLNKKILNIKTSGIRLFNNKANEIGDVIKFTLGEPNFDSDSKVINETIKSLKNNDTKYSSNIGDLTLRQSIKEYIKNKYHEDYLEDEILVTIGASEALATTLKTILNSDDEVICFEPSYPAYKPLVELDNCKYIPISLKKNKFQIDETDLKNKINNKTKAIIINSPNNPSGVILNEKSLDIIYKLVKDKNIFLIIDDIYNQLIYEDCPSLIKYQDIRDKMIFINSFSKSYAMQGYRLGYIFADKSIIDYLTLTHAYSISCVPTFIQKGSKYALTSDNSEMIKTYNKRRHILMEFFDKNNISYINPDGAFYLFVNISKFEMNSYDFASDLLNKGKVCVIPGRYFGDDFDDYVRLSYALSDEEIKVGLDRFQNYINKNIE